METGKISTIRLHILQDHPEILRCANTASGARLRMLPAMVIPVYLLPAPAEEMQLSAVALWNLLLFLMHLAF